MNSKSIRNKNKPVVILILTVVALAILGIIIFKKDIEKITQKSGLTTSPTPGHIVLPPAIITFTKNGVSPNKVEIKKGQRVIWINKSGETIALNSDDHPTHKKYPLLNFGNLKDGSAGEHIFEKQGTYGFHNHLKPQQKGVVIVN